MPSHSGSGSSIEVPISTSTPIRRTCKKIRSVRRLQKLVDLSMAWANWRHLVSSFSDDPAEAALRRCCHVAWTWAAVKCFRNWSWTNESGELASVVQLRLADCWPLLLEVRALSWEILNAKRLLWLAWLTWLIWLPLGSASFDPSASERTGDSTGDSKDNLIFVPSFPGFALESSAWFVSCVTASALTSTSPSSMAESDSRVKAGSGDSNKVGSGDRNKVDSGDRNTVDSGDINKAKAGSGDESGSESAFQESKLSASFRRGLRWARRSSRRSFPCWRKLCSTKLCNSCTFRTSTCPSTSTDSTLPERQVETTIRRTNGPNNSKHLYKYIRHYSAYTSIIYWYQTSA